LGYSFTRFVGVLHGVRHDVLAGLEAWNLPSISIRGPSRWLLAIQRNSPASFSGDGQTLGLAQVWSDVFGQLKLLRA